MDEQKVIQQVEKLELALKKAQEKLIEQDELLQQLAGTPNAFATVACLNNTEQKEQKTTFEMFKVGSKVKIRKDSAYYRQAPEEVGVLETADAVDRNNVDFSNGYYNSYRIGSSDGTAICDLELAEAPKVTTATIATHGGLLQVNLPKEKVIKPGDTVSISTQTMQIIDVMPPQAVGDIAFFKRQLDQNFVEIDHDSTLKVVFMGNAGKPEQGDRVVLDSTGTVIVKNMGKDDSTLNFNGDTKVSWSDIGGLAEAKQQMIEAVELPHTNPEIFKFYNQKPVKGILLYGNPGCGKTMLGKAAATALAKLYQGEGKKSGFIYVKGPEILDKYVGATESVIRQIFAQAKRHKKECGYPAVVFIDEADSILSKRGTGVSSDMEKTIVPMFLAEMDGLDDSGALVILATNRSDILDPAITRDGRIDRKIKIDRPTRESAKEIFLLNLVGKPLCNGDTHEDLAALCGEEVFDLKRVLYKLHLAGSTVMNFTLAQILNGGMIAGMVNQAVSIALNSDLKQKDKKPRGIGKQHLLQAIQLIENQNRELNHKDDINDFVKSLGMEVSRIERVAPQTA